LVERPDIHAPVLIALIRKNKVLQVRYLLWDDRVPFNPGLFAKPTYAKITEAK
jgi:hypothetical protein